MFWLLSHNVQMVQIFIKPDYSHDRTFLNGTFIWASRFFVTVNTSPWKPQQPRIKPSDLKHTRNQLIFPVLLRMLLQVYCIQLVCLGRVPGVDLESLTESSVWCNNREVFTRNSQNGTMKKYELKYRLQVLGKMTNYHTLRSSYECSWLCDTFTSYILFARLLTLHSRSRGTSSVAVQVHPWPATSPALIIYTQH